MIALRHLLLLSGLVSSCNLELGETLFPLTIQRVWAPETATVGHAVEVTVETTTAGCSGFREIEFAVDDTLRKVQIRAVGYRTHYLFSENCGGIVGNRKSKVTFVPRSEGEYSVDTGNPEATAAVSVHR